MTPPSEVPNRSEITLPVMLTDQEDEVDERAWVEVTKACDSSGRACHFIREEFPLETDIEDYFCDGRQVWLIPDDDSPVWKEIDPTKTLADVSVMERAKLFWIVERGDVS